MESAPPRKRETMNMHADIGWLVQLLRYYSLVDGQEAPHRSWLQNAHMRIPSQSESASLASCASA